MKISLNWLMDYIPLTIEREDLLHHLTDIGLEVGGTENWESVPGGMQGIVIGKVTACEQHPNADKLKVTRVNVGAEEELSIVCGAPNVAEGQTVVVATVGTRLTMNGEFFVIKKAKLRGEASHGMICSEDEIGIGDSHDGIMVLQDDIAIGTPASEYFKIEKDLSIDIDITPNRIDAASHLGVARDLAARLSFEGIPTEVTRPDVSAFKVDNQDLVIPVEIKNPEACKRYTSCTVSGVKVEDSPQWLQNRLKAIGLSPINNIVDITNYILHETGHPMHAFDADNIIGNTVVVEKRKQGEKFITLDTQERELHADDLMICDREKPMCIAGVFGGIDSGVTTETKNIFLESAWFDPVHVRKTARRHGLNTDASFRYERGADPEITIYALKRAALMIKEIAGGFISSEIEDVYPEKLLPFTVDIGYNYINSLFGEDISKETIRFILEKLDIKIVAETETEVSVNVPRYRYDVRRPADVAEEILRIYGYNRVPIAKKVNASINTAKEDENERLMQSSSDFLTARGFHEIMSNSLSNIAYYTPLYEEVNKDSIVHLANPGSSELSIMRREFMFGGIESIARNINHKQTDLKLYEHGKIYFKAGERNNESPVDNYFEEKRLGIWLSGDFQSANWVQTESKTNFYRLKSTVNELLDAYGIDITRLKLETIESKLFDFGLAYNFKKQSLVRFGLASKAIRKQFDIDQEVWYAEFQTDVLKTSINKIKNEFKPLAKFPTVHRDLALVLDKSVRFEDLKKTAYSTEKKHLKHMDLFDVYEGKGVESGKKSYAISFILQDEEKTMNDKQIDKIMQKLLKRFEKAFNAKLRG